MLTILRQRVQLLIFAAQCLIQLLDQIVLHLNLIRKSPVLLACLLAKFARLPHLDQQLVAGCFDSELRGSIIMTALIFGLRDRVSLYQHFAATHIIIVTAQILLMMLRGATFPSCLFLALVERWLMVLLLTDDDGVVRC